MELSVEVKNEPVFIKKSENVKVFQRTFSFVYPIQEELENLVFGDSATYCFSHMYEVRTTQDYQVRCLRGMTMPCFLVTHTKKKNLLVILQRADASKKMKFLLPSVEPI